MSANVRDSSPDELKAIAELAEAEAAEAEALAASARARARAIRLRREAELTEPNPPQDAQAEISLADEMESAQPEDHRDEPSAGIDTIRGPDDCPDAALGTPSRYRRWRRLFRPSTIPATLAIIVILVAVAVSIDMVLAHRSASQKQQRAAEFAAAARQGVVTLTSLDFNTAKADVQRIIDNSTGPFKDDFQKTADEFIKAVEGSKVVEQGSVEAAAVDLDSMTNDSAVVLVASKTDVTNAAGAKQDPRNFRLIVTVTREGDRLKMSKVQFVP